MSGAVLDYLARRRDRTLAELRDLVAIPSVSSLPEHAADIRRCAAWVAEELERVGLRRVEIREPGGHPLVYGEWTEAGPGAPTVLLYGHYDVQPPDPLELWTSPPFEPTIRDGCLYGRGVSDNKAQFFLNLKVLEALLAVEGSLPCNVKVLIEGEEELRADNLERFVAAHADLLEADLALCSDAMLFGPGVPGIPLAIRGMAALDVRVRSARADLHSGIYGGTVPNALHAAAELVAGLHGPDGRVLVEGFYDRVREVDPEERSAWAELPMSDEEFSSEAGVTALPGEAGFTPAERLWARPSLDVHGLWGGFTGEGIKTVVPAEARFRLSCRLVADQRPDEIVRLLEAHLAASAPAGCCVEIVGSLAGCSPVTTPRDHPAVTAALAALRAGYEREPVLFRAGWSVPAVEILDRVLGIDSLMLGFGLATDNHHAPDEHIRLDHFDRGLETMARLWPAFADLPRRGAAAVRPLPPQPRAA